MTKFGSEENWEWISEVSHTLDMTDQNNRLSDIKFSKMSFPNILEYNFQKQIIVPEKQFRF